MARFVVEWARAAGLEADVIEATPGRPSVVVRARGAGGGRTLLLCAHTDTVGVEGMAGPHTPRLEGDRLHGRGAYDMKAGLASALLACREAAGAELSGDVVVAAVADEEHASLGVQEVLGAVQADTALGARTHPLLGRGSVHASLIEGGAEMSSYPGRCVLGLERRTLPGETVAQIEAEVGGLIADPELQAVQRTLLVREPFEVPQDAELVRTVRATAAEILGSPPALAGAPHWADAAFIAAAGIPTVMFGASGAGAHAAEEWVSVADSVIVTQVLIAAARHLCG
ncbi:MAG: M20/M25/M40 family metallo-hydrolase [Solirubrobacteraceae bacterium]